MWHYKNLGDAMLADAEITKIKQENVAKTPLFVRYVAQHGLHCEVIVYFPPEAKNVAKHYLATPCLMPDERDLTAL